MPKDVQQEAHAGKGTTRQQVEGEVCQRGAVTKGAFTPMRAVGVVTKGRGN